MTTIRGRLIATLLTGLTMVLTAGGAAVYWIADANLTREFDAGLEARAHDLASLVKLEPACLVFETGDVPAAAIGETYFELRTQAGDVLKQSDNLAEASLPKRELLENELVFENTILPGPVRGRAAWFAFRPRVDPEDWAGLDTRQVVPDLLVVAAALDRGSIDRALATLLGALIVVGGVVAVTVAVLITGGIRWSLAPLDRLSGQLGSVSDRTISRRFDDGGAPRELAPIYRELNRMLDRVERALERERSFADAAAHELRTPLAELRTAAEVAIRWPEPERARASFTEMLAIGREMERLVDSLLLISRGNATALNGAMQEIPLSSIVHGCLERVTESIREKRLTLTVDLDERGSLRAPRDAVEIIIRNLIDNAVRYTPSDGSIAIRVEDAANGSPSLIVENEPVQLDENDLPRLFEPFWRREGSRSDRERAGLGLAVVHQLAHAIGLRVDAALAGDRLQIRVSTTA